MSATCPTCGGPLDEHDRHVRFGLPDPVLSLPDRERTAGTWMSHATPNESVLMQVPGVGAFARALLPVRLTGGHTVTFGVWMAIDPRQLRPTFDVWWEPAYVDLRLDGFLANTLPSFGCLHAPVVAAVRNVDHTPYCVESPDHDLTRVLTEEWDHEPLLSQLPQP